MERAIDKRIMLDLIIEAKKTDPEAGPFSEWLAEYLVDHLPTLAPPNEWVSVEERLPERGKDVLLYFEEESRISVGGRYDVGDGWYAVIVNEYETICDISPRY